jgi:hypothetical protein
MKSARSARELRKTIKETGLDRKNNSQNFESEKGESLDASEGGHGAERKREEKVRAS